MSSSRVLLFGLLLVPGLLPLYYGGVYPWSWSAAAIWTGMLSIIMVGQIVLGRSTLQVPMAQLKWPLILFLIVLAWIAVQWSPYTPEAWHHPLWQMAAETGGFPYQGRISLDPFATYESGIKLLSYGLMIFIAIHVGRNSSHARTILSGVTIIIAAYCCMGFIAQGFGDQGFLWFPERRVSGQLGEGGRLAMPFFSPNNLAAYASIGMIMCLAFILELFDSFMIGISPTSQKIKRFAIHLISHKWFLVCGVILFSTVLALSKSRGGTLALIMGLVALLVAPMAGSRLMRGSGIFASLALFVVLFSLVAGSYDGVLKRFSLEALSSVGRFNVYEPAFEAIEASPWLGYGYGSYKAVAKIHADRDSIRIDEFAHNTMLENTVELGIAGAIILAWSLVWLVFVTWNGVRRRRKNIVMPLIAFAVSVQLILYSLIDFPLQIPAIGYTYALILGIGVAQSFSSIRRN